VCGVGLELRVRRFIVDDEEKLLWMLKVGLRSEDDQ